MQPAQLSLESLDITAILVAVIAAIGGIAAAYYQYLEKRTEKTKRHKAEETANKAEEVAVKASVSEQAMASVADRALNLLESALENERGENEALRQLLLEAQKKYNERSDAIAKMTAELLEKASRIRELEHEVSALRGRVDQILNGRSRN